MCIVNTVMLVRALTAVTFIISYQCKGTPAGSQVQYLTKRLLSHNTSLIGLSCDAYIDGMTAAKNMLALHLNFSVT